MHTKSLVTLIVLTTALWGGFCIFSSRSLFINRRAETLLADNRIRSIIIETNSIEDVMKFATASNMLVVFDIDNTLAAPAGDVGTDQWCTYLIKKSIQDGMSYAEALDKILPLQFKLHDYLALYPLEKETVTVPDYLKKKGIPTLALTARSTSFADRTIEQLEQAGIVLNAPATFDKERSFTLDFPARYKDAIIFCARNDKGKTLIHLMHEFDFHPDCILYVDDRMSHVTAVEKECLENQMRYIGVRYGYCDERVKNFDPERAQNEYDQLINNINGEPVGAN